ncbi:hypothetical protein DPMN_182302 [Dreissena polymorpha]|uniref:Uncharacterized protein n=1 Tax=Dreissena polymorpha TaxID=45954 RepID=A0A9D4DFJ5_DREPO|nr:hypothetical protein DPMN_182302 [Dreissena polymorpha]
MQNCPLSASKMLMQMEFHCVLRDREHKPGEHIVDFSLRTSQSFNRFLACGVSTQNPAVCVCRSEIILT